MLKNFCLFTLSAVCSLCALENNPYDLALFGGLPATTIGGAVNAITGDYFIDQDDYIVRSHEPIYIHRTYSSRIENRTLNGWQYPFNHVIAWRNTEDDIEVPEKSGISLIYKINRQENLFYFTLDDDLGGLTNCYSGEISARADPTNNIIQLTKGTFGDIRAILVKGPDGSQRYYKLKSDYDFEAEGRRRELTGFRTPLFLRWETLPNKNKIFYDWIKINKMYFLQSVRITNSTETKEFSHLIFHYTFPDKKHLAQIKIVTSDNREINYVINSHVKYQGQRRWLLSRVELPERPNEDYTRTWNAPEASYYISYRDLPDGRFLHFSHYKFGKYPDFNIHVKHGDPLYRKVYALSESTGDSPGLEKTLFRFKYELGKYDEKEGKTFAYDSYNNLTIYHYNKNFLPTDIEHFIGENELFYHEYFSWYPQNTGKPNRLYGKIVGDKSGNPLFAHIFHYDEKGNLKEEELLGNLTGTAPENGILIENNKPISQGAERFSIVRAYYPNDLLAQEDFPNGKVIAYYYLEDTALLTAKFTYDKNDPLGTRKRYFYEYSDTILVREVQDNGTGPNVHDLNGVTQRIITSIIPVKSGSFIGMPEVISESYFDLENHTEILLSQKKISYTDHGQTAALNHFDASGKHVYTINYKYDGKGRIKERTNPYGRPHTHQYDENDNLLVDNDFCNDFTSHCDYDYSNNPIRLHQVPSSGGTKTFSNVYNLLNQKIKDIDPRGNATSFKLNPFGHVLKVTKPNLIDEQKSIRNPETSYEYNIIGNPLKAVDAEGNVTKTKYTCRGSPHHVTHPDESEEFYTYDLTGNLKTHISPTKIKVEYDYDFLDRITMKKIFSQNGELLSKETYTYDAFNLLEYIAPDGIQTYYCYDGAGRKISEATLDRETRYEYDELSRLVRTIHVIDLNHLQIFTQEYDLLDRMIKETEQDHDGNQYSITTYTYDDFSNKIALIKEVQAGTAIQKTFYDPFRREIQIIDPLGHITTIDYDDYYKNSYGQTVLKKKTTNPNGTQTVEVFDTHNNLSLLEKISSSGELLLQEEFFYNLNDQKIKQKSTLFSPHRTIIKTWKYDSRSRLEEQCEAVSENIERITAYSYDPEGNLTQIIKPSGLAISYIYDGLGRKTGVHTSDNTCHYELTYDLMGNIIEAKNLLTGKNTKRTYNHFGDLLSEKMENGLATTKEYDSLGRKIKLTLPDGSAIRYIYDPYHIKTIERLSPHNALLYSHTYDAYDQSHNLLSETLLGTLCQINHAVDLLSRRVKSTSPYSLEEITSFDPNGNVTNLLRSNKTFGFEYDPLDQLTLEQGLFNHTYAFDAHHDRLAKDEVSYKTNSHHELEDSSYEYHLGGNLITSAETTFSYDGLDRLIAINTPAACYCFRYDYFNRLLTQEASIYSCILDWQTTKEDYLFDERNELGAFPSELRILGQGLGAETGATIAIEKQNNIYAPLHDLFGNIISLINTSGKVAESYSYSAFGEEKIYNYYGFEKSNSTLANPWRYKSKRKIDSYVHFGRRFYDPSLGRFLSPDPKGFDEGPNLYQFALNNPFINIDLYGEEISEFWRHFAGPDHYSLDPIERIEHNKNEWVALATAGANLIGGLADDLFHWGSPSPYIDASGQITPTIAETLEDLVDQAFPIEHKDSVEFQSLQAVATVGLAANFSIFGRAAGELLIEPFISKGPELCRGLSGGSLSDITVYHSGITLGKSSKSVNLPSWKKISINMDHISSGHMMNGSRLSTGKTVFQENLSTSNIENIIRNAYRYGKKINKQGDRVLVKGSSQGIDVEMWVNTKTKTIETAYPIK